MKFFSNIENFKGKNIVAAFMAVAIFLTFANGSEAAKNKISPIADPSDPNSVIYLGTSGKTAGTGGSKDAPASEAAKAGSSWHPKALQADVFPKDKYGLVDWAESVRKGVIDPKGTIDPDEDEFPAMDLDVIIKSKSKYVKDVLYPHEMHTYWLKCEVCHPGIFNPEAGSNDMSMVEIAQGKWCGRCHGKVAFPLSDCTRCHSVEKEK